MTDQAAANLRCEPGSAGWERVVERLERRGDDEWPQLLSELRALAHTLAAGFRDVASADDVLGELALLAHERWLGEYVERARRGEARVSAWVFLRDRLRDHLREQRRRGQRREALLAPLARASSDAAAPLQGGAPEPGLSGALFASALPAPDDELQAQELRRVVTAGSPSQLALLQMREAGFEQREIAAASGLSRPTVSRRLAAIAALIATGLVTLVLAQVARESQSSGGAALRPEPIDQEATPPAAEERGVEALGAASSSERASPREPRVASAREPAVATPSEPPRPEFVVDERIEVEQPEPERAGASPAGPSRRREPPRRTDPSEDVAPVYAGSTDADDTTRETAPAQRAGTGELVIQTLPWARVFIDGRDTGRNTPVRRMVLPAGTHRLGLRTADGRMFEISIEIVAGEMTRVVRRLE